MFYRRPVFPGNSELEQFELVSKVCGSLTPDVWPHVVRTPLYHTFSLSTVYRRDLAYAFAL
jgi:cyclin-dependent kinase 12/13